MRRFLLRGLVIFAFFSALILIGGRDAGAAAPPFKWSKYTGADGEKYDYPSWTKGAGNIRKLLVVQGWLTYPETPPVTRVILKVYKAGAVPGSWQATPCITQTLTPNPTFTDGSGWLLTATDETNPQVEFTEGDQIKIVWEVRTTDNGVNTDSTVELVVTVTFH